MRGGVDIYNNISAGSQTNPNASLDFGNEGRNLASPAGVDFAYRFDDAWITR